QASGRVHVGRARDDLAAVEQSVLPGAPRESAFRAATRTRGEGPSAAAAERGGADPSGAERLDLAPRQLHPRRLDVRDAPPPRVLPRVAARPRRGDRAAAARAVLGPAPSHRQCTVAVAIEPAL